MRTFTTLRQLLIVSIQRYDLSHLSTSFGIQNQVLTMPSYLNMFVKQVSQPLKKTIKEHKKAIRTADTTASALIKHAWKEGAS